MPKLEIDKFVQKYRLAGYVECSALSSPDSVQSVFKKAVQLGLIQLGLVASFVDPGVEPDEIDGQPTCGICQIL